MIDTLAIFADQVTSVAREVGVEGKLGGQARVPGAAGTWRDLTDNVNQLAAKLTTQVRAIAEVATAVTKGDLTRYITVEALGEVAALKDNINEMIRNLKETTQKNTEQDWLKTNLAKFTRLLQGQRDLLNVSQLILSELAPLVSAQQGAFYIYATIEGKPILNLLAGYAHTSSNGQSDRVNAQFLHAFVIEHHSPVFQYNRRRVGNQILLPGIRHHVENGFVQTLPRSVGRGRSCQTDPFTTVSFQLQSVCFADRICRARPFTLVGCAGVIEQIGSAVFPDRRIVGHLPVPKLGAARRQ